MCHEASRVIQKCTRKSLTKHSPPWWWRWWCNSVALEQYAIHGSRQSANPSTRTTRTRFINSTDEDVMRKHLQITDAFCHSLNMSFAAIRWQLCTDLVVSPKVSSGLDISFAWSVLADVLKPTWSGITTAYHSYVTYISHIVIVTLWGVPICGDSNVCSLAFYSRTRDILVIARMVHEFRRLCIGCEASELAAYNLWHPNLARLAIPNHVNYWRPTRDLHHNWTHALFATFASWFSTWASITLLLGIKVKRLNQWQMSTNGAETWTKRINCGSASEDQYSIRVQTVATTTSMRIVRIHELLSLKNCHAT